jgi:hydroxyacylglutathione hydrolase
VAPPIGATLEANVILLLVLVLTFGAVVYGFFTYGGSGIGSHPTAATRDTPGAARPDEFSAFALRSPLPRDLKRLADGVYQLAGFPPNVFNVYLLENVLVDAGTRFAGRRLKRALHGRTLEALALTHAHFDHQGAASEICSLRDVPLWCGERDAGAMETGELARLLPDNRLNRVGTRLLGGPPYPVARRLREGDRVGSFRVLETPGPSPGHVSYWREEDRVLLLGDVLHNAHPVTGLPGLNRPLPLSTYDAAQNLESARKAAELRPALVCFGHGPPLRDGGRLEEFVSALSAA